MRIFIVLCASVLFLVPLRCRADMALLVEDPAGYKGFFSDSGHLSIWIQNACVEAKGVVRPCDGGSGVVLSSTSYWMARGWAAIPADLYLEGSAGELDAVAWAANLRSDYPELPPKFGRKYIGRLNHRGSYLLRIHTSAAQDASVLERIQQVRANFRYATFTSNCSDFAREVLDLYFPHVFGRRFLPDFGVSTPHGVADRFWKFGQRNPGLRMRVFYIGRRRPAGRLHDGRTKGICEAGVTDIKYALPLLLYQPEIYAAFGLCYLAVDQPFFLRHGFRQDAQHLESFAQLEAAFEASPLASARPATAVRAGTSITAPGVSGAGNSSDTGLLP